MRIEGHGGKAPISAYRFQGLDLNTTPYDYPWLAEARRDAEQTRAGLIEAPCVPASGMKYWGQHSPLGTHLGTLAREGHDYLSSPCGYCGSNVQKCKCGDGNYDAAPRARKTHREIDAIWI